MRLRLYLIEFSKVSQGTIKLFCHSGCLQLSAAESCACWWHHVTFLLVLVKVEHLEKTARVKNARGSKGK